jgi:hypothetical protein
VIFNGNTVWGLESCIICRNRGVLGYWAGVIEAEEKSTNTLATEIRRSAEISGGELMNKGGVKSS